MNTALPDFLRAIAAEPFVLGRSDCMTWLADWVMRVRNIPDPIANIRGAYSTEEGWNALLGEMSLAEFVDGIAERAGLATTRDPLPGDIGVIAVHGIACGAIMGRRGWLVRAGFSSGEPGIGWGANSTVLAAWRV